MSKRYSIAKWFGIIIGILPKFIIYLIILCALIPVFGIVGLYYFMFIDPFWGTSFNKKVWDSAMKKDGDTDCVRGGMYYDLKNNYLVIGTEKSEVVELLGEEKVDNNNCIDYSLGMCSGIRADYDSLVVCFQNDKITAVSHIQH